MESNIHFFDDFSRLMPSILREGNFENVKNVALDSRPLHALYKNLRFNCGVKRPFVL